MGKDFHISCFKCEVSGVYIFLALTLILRRTVASCWRQGQEGGSAGLSGIILFAIGEIQLIQLVMVGLAMVGG